jgi:hypothetical protein
MLVKNLDDTQDCRIVVDLVPFLAAPAVVRQRMVLQINHVVVGYFSVGRISQIECFVPAEILQLKPITSLLFSCPDHASPAQLNINGDGRDMAFSFSRLVICPAYVHTLA